VAKFEVASGWHWKMGRSHIPQAAGISGSGHYVVGVMTSMSSVVSVSRRNISGRILPKKRQKCFVCF